MPPRWNRRETAVDTLHRYRGVLLVVSVPVMVLMLVVALWPRAPTAWDEAGSTVGHLAPTGLKYSVVFDAGSTGSRVHVYRFEAAGSGPVLLDELFEQLKPGLSSYAGDAEAAAASLGPLIDKALERVPEAARADTVVTLRATAGLRMLPGHQAEDILVAVRKTLAVTGFKFHENNVSILDGADEGAYGWVAVNYLLGNMGKPLDQTVGVTDLGGGSVQVVYAVEAGAAKGAPEGYVKDIRGGGRTYHVYQHSYLGFGLMAGRAATLKQAAAGSCALKGAEATEFKYNGGASTLPAGASTGAFDGCVDAVASAMRVGAPCEVTTACSFDGAWGGGYGAGAKSMYLMSYLYERAEETKAFAFSGNDETVSGQVGAMVASGKSVCETSFADLPTAFPKGRDHPFMCVDASYIYALLTKAIGLRDNDTVTFVKKIKYGPKGVEVEAAWALGDAIATL